MDAQLLIEFLFSGVISGSIYALVGVGLTLVFGVMRMINFSHGEFYMLCAYVIFLLTSTLGINYFLGIAIAILMVGVTGVLVQRGILYQLRVSNIETLLLATLGVSIVFKNLVLMTVGADPRIVSSGLENYIIRFSFLTTTGQRMIICFGTLLAFLVLHSFLMKTRTGKAIRATAQNREAAQLVGIEVDRMSLIVFTVGALLAGLAGALISPVVVLYPWMGEGVILQAFVTVIIGGLGSVTGALAGGYILGISEALFIAFSGLPGYRGAVSFVILIILLSLRPGGLFGRVER